MTKNPEWLLEYEESVFSQHGEDGIIRKILSLLPNNKMVCRVRGMGWYTFKQYL